jgi:hypothetical protein
VRRFLRHPLPPALNVSIPAAHDQAAVPTTAFTASRVDIRAYSMARVRPLAHAPIIEALVDFRVQATERVTLDALNSALESHNFGYQRKGPILRGTFGVTVNMAQTPVEPQMLSNAQIVGARLESSDGRNLQGSVSAESSPIQARR